MKALPLRTDFTPTESMKYVAASYPGEGMYCYGEDLFIVSKGSAAPPHPSVFVVTGGAGLLKLIETEAPSRQEVQASGPALSEAFLLKAMAIAQDPTLALDLAK